MARTRSKDYDAIKEAILDRAADLFARKSFSETSITEISEASGLSKSGVYHYFKSKHDVLYAIMSEYVETILEAVGTALRSSPDPIEQFETLTLLLLERYSESKSRHAVLTNELGCLKDNERTKIVALERRIVDLTETIVEKIKPALAGRAKEMRPVVMLFFGMINGTYSWYEASRGMHPDQLARIASRIFINGLLATDFADKATRSQIPTIVDEERKASLSQQ